MRWLPWSVLVVLLVSTTGTLQGQTRLRPWGQSGIPGTIYTQPCPPCIPAPAAPSPESPPSKDLPPAEPGKEPSKPPTTPPAPETPSPSTASTGDSLAQAGEAGTEPAASFSPNMFGDFFGARSNSLVIPRAPIIIPGRPAVNQTIGGVITVAPNNPQAVVFTGPSLFVTDVTANQAFNRFGQNFPQGFIYTLNTSPSSIPPPTAPVFLNKTEEAAAAQFAAAQYGPGGTLTYLANQSNGVLLGFPHAESEWNLQTFYLYSIPAVPEQIIPQEPITLILPNPSGGGAVGRTKISEDNSPLPRDRIIFNYDYFNNVPLTFRGLGVHRFSPGIEKTFFDQRASIEIRLPFASTLSSDVIADGGFGSKEGEFGNVSFILKTLLYRGKSLFLAGGLGFSLPTADDVHVRLIQGPEVVRIKNDALILTPYVAVLYAAERMFFQSWIQLGFDTNGNPVDVNLDQTGLRGIGRLHDQTLFQWDTQIGYWAYQASDPQALVQGLAPFVELHWNSTLGNPDVLTAGGYQIGALDGHINELNLSAGWLTQMGDSFNLTIGAVVPLLQNGDRSFDYQLGIRGNLFFGPTLRSRNAAARVSSF